MTEVDRLLGKEIRLRSDLFWILGSIEGGIDARKHIVNEADGLLAQFIQQDIMYLERLRDKMKGVIKLVGGNVDDESQTSSSSS